MQDWKCLQLYLKETPAQAFSCEIDEFFKNTFLYGAPLVAASELKKFLIFSVFCYA